MNTDSRDPVPPNGSGPAQGRATITTATVDNADPSARQDVGDYLDACLGGTEGRAIVAVGRSPHVTDAGKYTHERWEERRYAWPGEREHALDDIRTASPDADVYVCPYLMKGDRRAKGEAVTRQLVHTDVDGDLADAEKVRVLGGYAVASGTPGHYHAYVPLAEPVTAAEHESLCRGLGRHLGARDAKISDNDLLRIPGTVNHKPDGGPVRWLVHPSESVRRTPGQLARQLGVKLANALTSSAPGNGNGCAAPQSTSAVDLAAHPAVQAELERVTGDRSDDSHRVVAACHVAGLTLAQTRWAVGSRTDLAQRLAGRTDDDVLRSWLSAVDEQQRGRQREVAAPDSTDAPPAVPVYADRILTRSALRTLPDPEPLIDNVLDQGTVALLYGSRSTLKTFIALDWGACVATERPWQGRPTVRRRVLYVVGEGAFGINRRLNAWETGWHSEIRDGDLDTLPEPVNLTRVLDVANLAAFIDWGGYSFVVLDTLARCMVGADENSAKDCGVVVDSMTRLLAATPGGRGVVLGVHHAGKDGKTLRGSSAFEAAADTVYFSRRDGAVIVLDREKRKDGPELDRHELTLDPIEGTHSAVLSVHRGGGQTDRGERLLSTFVHHFAATGASKSELRLVADMPPATFHRALSDLVNRGALVNTGTDKRPFYVMGSK